MNSFETVADHYHSGRLLEAIAAGVARLGKTTTDLSVEDLAPVDEFHIGGAPATRAFLDGLALEPGDHALDIGCGIGGTSRFAATEYGCRVTGVDLTREYVETGQELCRWLDLDSRVDLVEGNAVAMSFPDEHFDKAFMLHVGMNISDKEALVAEAWRVLKPGGVLGVYDVMRRSEGTITFPVPWATEADASFVVSPDTYKAALERAGFELTREQDRGEAAGRFFENLAAATSGASEPPALGLHLLMGANAATKVQNMVQHVKSGLLSPVELIARKPA
jgi:SAM-dependent methyltransferase